MHLKAWWQSGPHEIGKYLPICIGKLLEFSKTYDLNMELQRSSSTPYSNHMATERRDVYSELVEDI